MKILKINKYYYPDIGGVETVVQQYAQAASKDYEVTVICAHKQFKLRTTQENFNGIKVIRCSSLGTFFSMPVSVAFYAHFLFRYRKYDILHFHEPFPLGSLLALFLNKRKKIVVTWHSDIVKQKFLKRPVELIQKLLCTKASIVTTTSPNLLRHSSVISKLKEKTKVLPLGIDVDNYDNRSVNEGNYILYLGRLAYYKGINVLLRAFEVSETDMELLIVGDGNKEIVDTICKAQAKSQKKIRFINKFVTEKEKQSFLENCCFLVFPSIEPSEAFGIIQLEAMILGKPVINTNLCTGVPYVSLDGLTGITVEPNNVLELGQAIDKLATNNEMRNTMGIKARRRVHAEFSNKRLMTTLLEIYKHLMH